HLSTLSLHDALPISPLRVKVLPTILGSRLKRPAHSLYAMRKTGGAPGLSSSGINVLPRSAGTPRTWNMFAVTYPPLNCSVPSPRSEEHTSELQSPDH